MNSDQYEFLNDRVDHCVTEHDALKDRVLALESAKEVKKAHTLEVIVIVLILIEIVQSYFQYRHG